MNSVDTTPIETERSIRVAHDRLERDRLSAQYRAKNRSKCEGQTKSPQETAVRWGAAALSSNA
jgi:hypothetical protein